MVQTDCLGLPFENVIKFFLHINKFEKITDILRNANDIPPPITRTATTTDIVNIVAKEAISELAPGIYQNLWIFNGIVPGPFMRVMEGDTVVINLHNDKTSLHHHSIDFYAVIGPGAGRRY